MKSNTVYLDFEFNRVTHSPVNLVCCVTKDAITGEVREFWLHNDAKEKKRLKEYLSNFNYFICYSAIAECRSLIALGIDPRAVKWVDLFLEYRCLSNHNDELMYGPQYVDGKIKQTKKRNKYDDDSGEGFRQTHSLSEACFKLLNIQIDSEHKKIMRDLIISDPVLFTTSEKRSILEYCKSDVINLPNLWETMRQKYREYDPSITLHDVNKFAYTKGEYAAITSIMEERGYPFNYEKTKNFSSQVGNILYNCQKEINTLFPEVQPFKWNRVAQAFRWDRKATEKWLESILTPTGLKKWKRTDTGELSLSLEAFEAVFDFKHDYPKDNLGAQFVRFLKLKQNLYGFSPSKGGRKTFWDYVGPDKRVRPYFNIYGAATSRSQPSATSFLFLKPAWMRALVEPRPGYALAGIDYSSQEFLLSAILAEDTKMFEAYKSGDPYLAFAKQSYMVPENATKESHKSERNLCKSTVLGLSYLMSKVGLAIKLSYDTGKEWTEDQAQEMIDIFYDNFSDLAYYQQAIIQQYKDDGYLRLEDGWYTWGDNDNFRSATNFTIQGVAASIMRNAVKLAFSRGLYVCITLHDALYIEYKVGEENKIEILYDCMKEAFVGYFEKDKKMSEWASYIRMDPYAWSPDYKGRDTIETKNRVVDCGELYIDERSIREYEQFKKYFDPREEDEL